MDIIVDIEAVRALANAILFGLAALSVSIVAHGLLTKK